MYDWSDDKLSAEKRGSKLPKLINQKTIKEGGGGDTASSEGKEVTCTEASE